MKSITNKLGKDENVGSVWRLMFLPINDLLSGLPDPVRRPYNDIVDINGITTATYSEWFVSEFQLSTIKHEYTEDQTANGIIYKHTISWTVGKDYNSRRIDFDDMEGRKFAVFLVDNNGKGYFFGYKTSFGDLNGMVFSKKKTIGVKVTDLNSYTLQFYMESFCQQFNAVYTTFPPVDLVRDDRIQPLPGPGTGTPIG